MKIYKTMWAKLKHNSKSAYYLSFSLVFIVLILCPFNKAGAVLSTCQISLSPQTVSPNSDNYFTFGLYNSRLNSDSIRWLNIVAPEGSYISLESAFANGWNGNIAGRDATFTDGQLDRGVSQGFEVQAYANEVTSSPLYWSVQASDDPSGANAVECSGDLSTSIVQQASQIDISNTMAIETGPDYAVITWDTNVPATSKVIYSQDYSFSDSTPTDDNLVTAHSVTIRDLSANTDYNFYVVSTTLDGGYSESGQNTFLTTAADQQEGGGNNGGNNQGSGAILGGGIPILKKPIEKISPTVTFKSNVAGVYKTAPTINGIADDNIALARIQYSTDGGQNWLPVDQAAGLGNKHASFSFRPLNLKDGTYDILVRAIDTSGNIGFSTTQRVVIARVAPLVGGYVLSLGSQVLKPDASGKITSVARVDQKVTLSAVGGPTKIYIEAINKNLEGKTQTFSLTKSSDNNLWSGIINFSTSGQYTLIAHSQNGAGVKATKLLNETIVADPAKTIDSKTLQPINTEVKVYYFEPQSKKWLLWDGDAYGQINPQVSAKSGEIRMFLPPGKYYLQASSAGYQTVISKIFETKVVIPLATQFKLKPLIKINLGLIHLTIPSLSAKYIDISSKYSNDNQKTTNSLVGKTLPAFNLINTDGQAIQPTNLLGKPSVITFGSTWSPDMSEQIAILSRLQSNKNINVVPIAFQENMPKVKANMAIANLNLTWLADPDSTLSDSYKVQSLPTHFFTDRRGKVTKVVTGMLNETQITDNLREL